MKPHKKHDATTEMERESGVDRLNDEQKTNEQEEEGGGYARPRTRDVPGHDRPPRGGS